MKRVILVLGISALIIFAGCVQEGGETTFELPQNSSIITLNGTEFIEQELSYDEIIDIAEINNKPSYLVGVQNDSVYKRFILYENEEIGKEYKNIHSQLEIDGKLAYNAFDGEESFIVFDGEEIGRKYEGVYSPVEVDDKLACLAKEESQSFIVYKGQEIGKDYDRVSDPTEINEKLAYIAKEDTKEFLVYEGEEGDEYDDVRGLKEINNKPAYSVRENKSSFILYDNKKFGEGYSSEEYTRVSDPMKVNEELAYRITRGIDWSRETSFVYEGKEYKDARELTGVDGKLAYVLISGRERTGKCTGCVNYETVISYGGKKIGQKYDSVSNPTEVNGKLVFSAREEDNLYVVIEK